MAVCDAQEACERQLQSAMSSLSTAAESLKEDEDCATHVIFTKFQPVLGCFGYIILKDLKWCKNSGTSFLNDLHKIIYEYLWYKSFKFHVEINKISADEIGL